MKSASKTVEVSAPDLRKLAIEAHGGLDRWKRFTTLSVHGINGGVLWGAKGKAGVLDDVTVTVDLRNEEVSPWPFGTPDRRSRFEPQRVALENASGKVIEELLQPRSSFQGHTLETPWSDLQLAYFAGCAMWTYLNTPFLLARPGIKSEEVEPWQEARETWRRLRVRFPADIATHSTEQTLYFDPHTTSRVSRSSLASSFRRRGESSLSNRTAIPYPNRWSSPSTWTSLSSAKDVGVP